MIEKHNLNEEIEFGTYNVNLLDDKENVLAEGSVRAIQKFHPQPNFIFRGEFDLKGDPIHLLNLNVDKCFFTELDLTIDIILTNFIGGKNFTASFILSESPLEINLGKELSSIKFYLINFNHELEREALEFGDWCLTIEKTAPKEQFRNLKKLGGYLVTHRGKVTHKKKNQFSPQKIGDLTDFLYLLFSFCKGVPTSTFLVQGFDVNHEMTWYQIGNHKINPWKHCQNWFSDSRLKLNSFASGFYKFFNEQPYGRHLNEIIYWYNSINEATNNYSSVILSHTALELISWIYLTEDKKVLSSDGYNKLPSGECLSLVLGYNSIDPNVPKQLKRLHKLSKENNLNSPQLYSTIRNKIIHPPSKRRDEFTDGKTIYEAKLLGAWYIEMFILSKSNFEGEYTNILNYSRWKGDKESLPWMKNT